MNFTDIKDKALELGVDSVHFLNLKDYKSPRSPDPQNYLPEARSLVVFILREIRGGYMNRSIIRMTSLGALDRTMNYITYKLARYIEDSFDTDAMVIPDHRPFEINKGTLKSIIGPVSLRHAAVQCGAGVFGRNTLVVNPKWGSMIRIGAILIDLPLPSDEPINYDPCKNCDYPCVDNCPAGAIQGDRVDQRLCTCYSQPYDVGNFMRFMMKWEDMSSPERKEFLLSPHWFNLYMAGMGYMYYRCTECSRGCPGEKHKKMYKDKKTMVGYATTLENPGEMTIENPLALKK